MAAPLIAGLAARALAKKVATSAAKKATQKTVKKVIQKSKTNQIAKNSVKVKDADNIKRLRSNVDSYYKTVKAKSGATAKEKAAEVTRSNKITNPQVLRVKSSSTKPYKVTGGAGSTARRAAEKAKKNK